MQLRKQVTSEIVRQSQLKLEAGLEADWQQGSPLFGGSMCLQWFMCPAAEPWGRPGVETDVGFCLATMTAGRSSSCFVSWYLQEPVQPSLRLGYSLK